uniref:TGF-beta propeptide domain-containing protein n=1 Tax=Falco tinnunculus TaxID=100819 RepID=A0A8C4UCR7_FALTI
MGLYCAGSDGTSVSKPSVSKQDSDAAVGTETPGRSHRSLLRTQGRVLMRSHLLELIPPSLSAFSFLVFWFFCWFPHPPPPPVPPARLCPLRLCNQSLASACWGFIYFYFILFFVLYLPDASPSAPEQRYLFDISSLPEAEEVTGAELRVLRSLPENRSLALSPEGTFHHLLLSTCPAWDGEEPQLLDSRAADILDAGSSRWEVFDVWEALRDQRQRSLSGKLLCFLLRIISDQSGRLLPPWQLGFSKPRPQPHERALLVAFSRTQRKENLFKEIRDKIKALGSISLRGAHQPCHHPDPDELHGPGVYSPQLLCALQAQPHQHPLHRLWEQCGLQTV